MDVVVTGASGLIGRALVAKLAAAGHRAIPMTRAESPGQLTGLLWDPGRGQIDAGGLDGVDAVVHLAGAGIGDRRWNDAHKRAVLDSRVQGTSLLAETLAKLERPPSVLVSASAVGYYGDRGDEELTEDSAPGRGFLADVCRQWEAATAAAEHAGIRVVRVRTGIVLDGDGGVLPRMLRPFRLGVGGRLGSGRQWMSWITLGDHVEALLHTLQRDDMRGAFNLTAPAPATNADFSAILGRVLHRPARLPAPGFALRLLLGSEMAHELLLSGQRVRPRRLEEHGFQFAHPELDGALRAVLHRT